MKSYLLDTSVVINYLRGHKETVKLLNTIDGALSSSYVCLAELYEGVFRAKNREKTEEVVTNFFKSLSEIYSIDSDVARYFGRIRAELKIKGKVIEDMDIFLAATCLAYDLILITNNVKHFSKVPNLTIYGESPV